MTQDRRAINYSVGRRKLPANARNNAEVQRDEVAAGQRDCLLMYWYIGPTNKSDHAQGFVIYFWIRAGRYKITTEIIGQLHHSLCSNLTSAMTGSTNSKLTLTECSRSCVDHGAYGDGAECQREQCQPCVVAVRRADS